MPRVSSFTTMELKRCVCVHIYYFSPYFLVLNKKNSCLGDKWKHLLPRGAQSYTLKLLAFIPDVRDAKEKEDSKTLTIFMGSF